LGLLVPKTRKTTTIGATQATVVIQATAAIPAIAAIQATVKEAR
jgi:hypothetical protein